MRKTGPCPRIVPVTLIFLITICSTGVAGEIGFIKPAADNFHFIDSSTSEIFAPIGCNYYDATTGWAPHPWGQFHPEKIKKDFARMEELGVNIARVPILTGRPWITVTRSGEFKANEQTLENFRTFLESAKKHKIRLILAVFDWENYPYHLGDKYVGERALAYQEFGYKMVAGIVKDEPIVFGYTLGNEPRNTWGGSEVKEKWNQWLKEKYQNTDNLAAAWGSLKDGEEIGRIDTPPNKHDPGSERLYDYQLFREEIAYKWTKRMASAVRAVDKNHMISVGNIQWSVPFDRSNSPRSYTGFNTKRLTDLLDFTCIHYYPFGPYHPNGLSWDPSEETFKEWLYAVEAMIRYSYRDKPVLLEEFNWGIRPKNDQIDNPEKNELIGKWNKSVIAQTRNCATGWLSWPFQDTASSRDISYAGGFITADGKLKPWGRYFIKLAKELKRDPAQYAQPDVIMNLDKKSLLTSGEALERFWRDYLKLRHAGFTVGFKYTDLN